MKGTKIAYTGRVYNKDGDRPIKLNTIPTVRSEKEIKKLLKDKDLVFIKVTDKELLGVNKLKFQRKSFYMVEPNPVTFYFSLAYDVVDQLVDAKSRLANALQSRGDSKTVAFSYVFKVSSVGIIFTFLALEAFTNQMLPDYGPIKLKNGKVVDKEHAQRFASIEYKINTLIPQICNKDFAKQYPKKMDRILALKKLRDELTHLKEIRKNGFTSYDNIYQDILNLNLKLIVSSVKIFINFYNPGLISNYKGRTMIR